MQIGDKTVRVPYEGLQLLFKIGQKEALLVRHKCNLPNGSCPSTGYAFLDFEPNGEPNFDEVVLLAVKNEKPVYCEMCKKDIPAEKAEAHERLHYEMGLF